MECGGLREMTTREFIERFRPEDRENLANAFRELQRIGSMNITARVGHIDRPTYVDLRGRLSEDMREGSGVAFDVTRQRIAERRAIAAERRLREAIDVFTGPFAEWDSRKRLLHCNRAFGLTFNIPPEALQRGATYESVASRIAKIVRSETPSSTDSRVRETELVDGRWLQIADRPTLDGRLITFGLDITALKRNEEAVMKSERRVRRSAEDLSRAKDRADLLAQMHAEEKRKADAANKAKSVFLANTGHELRTPLVAINGFSEMLTKQIFGPLGNPKYLEYAKDVHAAGTHLLDVINDILDMAKIEAGKMTISRASMDVEDAIDEAVRIMRQKIQDKGLALHINIVPLPEIDGDHRSVRQMMLNLLSNALKFTEQGSITVSARLEGEFIRITVADTGIGIPEEALARLGKPFEQVEEAHRREFKGTGLGLALTRSFAEMHGGRMEIASQLKVGTQMSILLPARLAPVAAATAAE
jgi:two-component system cell cycle sensor histidine kinase PleC